MSKADQKVPFVFPSTPTVELASEGTFGMEHFQLTKSHIDGRNKRAWGILESQQTPLSETAVFRQTTFNKILWIAKMCCCFLKRGF